MATTASADDNATTQQWMTAARGGNGAGAGQGLDPDTHGGRGRRGGGQMGDASLMAVAADMLDMTRRDLVIALLGGKSIADLAGEKGIDPDTIVEAFLDTKAERLQEMVDAGRLTQEQADAILANARQHASERIAQPFEPGQGPRMGGGGPCWP